MATMHDALKSLRPTSTWAYQNDDYNTIQWFDSSTTKPTSVEVQNEIARLTEAEPYTVCSEEAKKRLAASDWSVLPDVNISNKAEFETYRSALRTLVFNPVAEPTFPTEPQPIWI